MATTSTLAVTTSTPPVSTSTVGGGRPDPSARRHRVTQRSVVRAEWIKFRSVRSNVITLLVAGVALVAFGTLFASVAGSGEDLPRPGGGASDSLSASFGGLNVSQLVLGILGALFVAGEYSTGLIRTMFTAVATRTPVLRGKAIVLAAGSWVVMTVAAFVAFFVGQASYAGTGPTFALTDDGVLRSILGVGVYGAGVVLLGVALGFLLRSTAAAIGILVGALMVAPGLVGLLPDSIATPIGKILPSNAGTAFTSVVQTDEALTPAVGFGVFALWVVGLLIAAAVVLRRRDA